MEINVGDEFYTAETLEITKTPEGEHKVYSATKWKVVEIRDRMVSQPAKILIVVRLE
jgi:hypothetical protein